MKQVNDAPSIRFASSDGFVTSPAQNIVVLVKVKFRYDDFFTQVNKLCFGTWISRHANSFRFIGDSVIMSCG